LKILSIQRRKELPGGDEITGLEALLVSCDERSEQGAGVSGFTSLAPDPAETDGPPQLPAERALAT
jgi:hypothetical protein